MANIIDKGNGSYLIRISRGTDSRGKQTVRSKIFRPSSPTLPYRKLKKEIEDFTAQFEEELDRESEMKDPEKFTFSDFSKEYLKIKETVLSPNTLAFYKRVIEDELIPRFGKLKLRDIKTFHIQDFITYLSTEMPRKDGHSGIIKPQTVKRYTTVLRSIMSLAYKLEYTDDDVGQSKRITFPKEQKTEIEVFTLEEVSEILKALKTEPLHIQSVIEIALFAGCRRGEIVGLKWEDIDLDTGKLTVKRSIYKPHGSKAQEKSPKSSCSYRTISIPKVLCDTLRAYKEQQDRHISFMGDAWINNGYVFTEENGSVMNPQTPTKQFDHFLKRHSIRHLKFHGLRHTSATILLSQGCDIKTVSARLGHADLETTNILCTRPRIG